MQTCHMIQAIHHLANKYQNRPFRPHRAAIRWHLQTHSSSNTGIQSSSDDGASCQTDDTAGTGAHRVSVGQESGGRCRCLPHFCECFYWHSDPVSQSIAQSINLMSINQSINQAVWCRLTLVLLSALLMAPQPAWKNEL